jgi:hypothetical protein
MRWSMNQAVGCDTDMSLANWQLEIPFLCDKKIYIAINHFLNGTLLSWKIVPTLTEYNLLHFLHLILEEFLGKYEQFLQPQ